MKKKLSKIKESRRQFEYAKVIRLILAGYILIIMALQLFTFEDFPNLITVFDTGKTGQYAIAIILVLLELASLPFLLGMHTREVVLNISFGAGIAALLLMSIVQVSAFNNGETAIFGATFDLPGGSWSLFFLSAMWLLVLWSGYYLFTANKRQ